MAISNPTPPPIIIIKKKGGHGGHHGGAWKVAYADFVTAMMALFIVLWLLSSSEQVKKAVGGYFQDPTGTGKHTGTTQMGAGEGILVTKDDMSQLEETLKRAMEQLPKFQQIKDHVEMTITSEGLRIELSETEKGMFFESGRRIPTESCVDMLSLLAQQLAKLPNRVMIEGHTDAQPYAEDNSYSNWELSADRANSARKVMQTKGLRADQVSQVRGFADQRLRLTKDPKNPANRRVSIIVQYRDMPPQAAAEAAKKGEAGHGAASHGEAPKAEAHGEPPKTAASH